VAPRWGDIEFGGNDRDFNRYILVQHNYVRRQHTSTKSKTRRVDMSRELRRALLELRTARLRALGAEDPLALADELVFQSRDGGILDPDNFTTVISFRF
jgi:integrase